MQAEINTTIDGRVVIKEASFENIDVYSLQNDDQDFGETFFFVNRNTKKVVQTLRIEADCNQNTGFVSEYVFEKGE